VPRRKGGASNLLSLQRFSFFPITSTRNWDSTPANGKTSRRNHIHITARLASSLIAAVFVSAAVLPLNGQTTFQVNSSGDGHLSTTRGETACETAFGNGVCTLRAAIEIVNRRNTGLDQITFHGVTGAISLGSALPDLSTPVTISGPGADRLMLTRPAYAGAFRIFNVTTTGTVSISSLTIDDGGPPSGSNGGGIQNVNAGTVNVTNCTLSNNSVTSAKGGGIHNDSTGTINITGSTFTNNSDTTGGGGAIFNNYGTVSLTNSTLESNSVTSGNGGGIYNYSSGTVTVTNSAISDNVVSSDANASFGGGAGIFNIGGGTVTVIGSTLSGNLATGNNFNSYNTTGGGILNYGTLHVTNSTLFANNAINYSDKGGAQGGALSNYGTASVTNSTLALNSAYNDSSVIQVPPTDGGGIYNSGTMTVKSTIIASNFIYIGSGPDVSGTFTSSGFNLIGKNDGAAASFPAGNPNANNDIVGTSASAMDPKLDPNELQDNGGPTRTIALLPGSPAIDKGTSNGLTGQLTTDQRGTFFLRTADYSNVTNPAGGDGTDIGAFEFWTLKITSISRLANGHALLHGVGIPNHPHTLAASPDPDRNDFVSFPSPVNADGAGALQYDDAGAIGLTKRFYRLNYP